MTILGAPCCNRDRPPEPPTPPATAPSAPSTAPRAPSLQNAALQASRAALAEPAGHNDACVLFPEVALRVFAGVETTTAVQQEHSDLAGLTSCRYRWRKADARTIASRNQARTRTDPRLLGMLNSHRAPSDDPVERLEGEVRVGVYPVRSGTESMLRRAFETAHFGESIISSLGDQSAWEPRRMLLTVRKGNRTIEVLSRPSEDEEVSLALATRIARDMIGRLQ